MHAYMNQHDLVLDEVLNAKVLQVLLRDGWEVDLGRQSERGRRRFG